MPYIDPEAQREYQRKWVMERRAGYFRGKACIDCGRTDLLEIDHVDPKQKVSHKIWSWSESRRVTELAKCVVRCHPCHVAKTTVAAEWGGGSCKRVFGHFTAVSYNDGCRCPDCQHWKQAYKVKRVDAQGNLRE